MNNKFFAAMVALTFIAVGNVDASAQGFDGNSFQAGNQRADRKANRMNKRNGMKMGQGQRGAFAAIRTTLSPEQKQQLKAIRVQQRSQTAGLRTQLQSLRAQAKAGGGQADPQLRAQMKGLRQQLKQHRDANKAQMMAILTPAQRAQVGVMN